jgi:thiol-disulfide isomerase/thioredoxin
MDEQTQTSQTDQPSMKKGFWQYASPKTTFIFGLILGVAAFASLSLLYSYLALGRLSSNQAAVGDTNQQEQTPAVEPTGTQVGSFIDTGKTLCKENGKPVVTLYSTTWCPHCQWIQATFDKVVSDAVKQGKIVAYHWQLDTGDNTLTKAVETSVPASEEAIYNEFNPNGSIPTFVFGCRYYRIGNGYEQEGDAGKAKEEQEFKDLINKMLTGK